MSLYAAIIPSPLGNLLLTASNYGLVSISKTEAVSLMIHPIMENYVFELNEYFGGKRKTFSFGFSLDGTEFQKKVWNALTKIPYGETRTYKQIASMVGRPKAARAVGAALGANPLPVVVPCHRVVATHGLGGYSGGLDAKKTLLTLEGQDLTNF